MAPETFTPSIKDFFSGKNIFITGATGFLGKALIEKLLRSCPKIGDIYVLVRTKKGKLIQERLQLFVNDAVYERVKREQPDLKLENKIIPLAGDVQQLNLGLSTEDRNILIENVNIIFHVAASVRFDDPLDHAVFMNIRGTREVCQLALDTKHLLAHMHVSTAFVNCDRSEVKEILYPVKMDWKKLIEIAEKCDKNILKALTEKILDEMPNTYCFTKNVAEHVTYDMLVGRVPCKIFRPSIVTSAMHDEPVKGWVDNFNGPVGVNLAFGKGIMRTIYSPNNHKPDYIPVDIVTKACIISTWDLSVRSSLVPEVIHATAYKTEWLRVSAKLLAKVAREATDEIPLNNILWTPANHVSTSIVGWYIRTVFTMLIPSIFIDLLLKLAGHKPMLVKLQKKIFVGQCALRYFMTNEWDYQNDNLLTLKDLIQENNLSDWNLDFENCDFRQYLINCIYGSRKYLLNEPDSTLEQAKKHSIRMMWVDRIVKTTFLVVCLWASLIYCRYLMNTEVETLRL